MTRKQMFNIVFNKALEKGTGLLVKIEAPNMPDYEIIINPPKNVPTKIEYYNEAYDDEMKLKANNKIKMVTADVYYIL